MQGKKQNFYVDESGRMLQRILIPMIVLYVFQEELLMKISLMKLKIKTKH
jgi:hypothetical protein